MADHYESSAWHIDEVLVKLAASADASAVFHASECQCRGTMRSYTVRSNIKRWRIYGVGDADPEITAHKLNIRARAHTRRGTHERRERRNKTRREHGWLDAVKGAPGDSLRCVFLNESLMASFTVEISDANTK